MYKYVIGFSRRLRHKRAKAEQRSEAMTPGKDQNVQADRTKATDDQGEPDWADGLRQLYDSVVEEELPDSFKDLLSKLDQQD